MRCRARTKAFAALQDEPRRLELRPWLFRIAHNESIDLVRRRRSTDDLETAAEVGHDLLSQQVETREQLRLLQADLADLADRQRSALVLRELSGLSHEEIAAVLETTPRAVKQVIFEARAALHECREGRAMACEQIRRAVSDGDGRALRGRRLRAHLRTCDGCRSFQAELRERPAQLAALCPVLPAAASAAIFAHLAPTAKAAVTGATGAGAATTGGAAATGGLGALLGGKSAVVAVAVALAATAGGGAAALTENGNEPGNDPTQRQRPERPASGVGGVAPPATTPRSEQRETTGGGRVSVEPAGTRQVGGRGDAGSRTSRDADTAAQDVDGAPGVAAAGRRDLAPRDRRPEAARDRPPARTRRGEPPAPAAVAPTRPTAPPAHTPATPPTTPARGPAAATPETTIAGQPVPSPVESPTTPERTAEPAPATTGIAPTASPPPAERAGDGAPRP